MQYKALPWLRVCTFGLGAQSANIWIRYWNVRNAIIEVLVLRNPRTCPTPPGIFGPIPWLASTHLEYFWPIRSPLDHVLTKPRVSLVREDIRDDSQTFFYGSCICHRTGSQSWTIHNPRKNAHTLRLLPIQLRVRGSCVVFVRHVTKQPSDWPELFVMARTKESAQRYQTTFFAAILLAEVVGWERD